MSAKIGAGTPKIQQHHEAKRAQHDEQIDNLQKETEAKKAGAKESRNSAFEEVNKNNSDTLTGAVKEGAQDILEAAGKEAEYILASVQDAMSDAKTETNRKIYNTGSKIVENAQKGASFVGDVGTAVVGWFKGVTKGIREAGAQGAQEELDKKYEQD